MKIKIPGYVWQNEVYCCRHAKMIVALPSEEQPKPIFTSEYQLACTVCGDSVITEKA